MKDEINFLDVTVGKSGTQVDRKDGRNSPNLASPKNLTDLRSFMTFLRLFIRFMKDFINSRSSSQTSKEKIRVVRS